MPPRKELSDSVVQVNIVTCWHWGNWKVRMGLCSTKSCDGRVLQSSPSPLPFPFSLNKNNCINAVSVNPWAAGVILALGGLPEVQELSMENSTGSLEYL